MDQTTLLILAAVLLLLCSSSSAAVAYFFMAEDTTCKPKQAGYLYKRRVSGGNGTWVCPAGYEENYCTWDDGDVLGELQCRKKK